MDEIGGINAGDVFARLGAVLDERNFRAFDAAVEAADRKHAEAELGAKFDDSQFRAFDKSVRDAQNQRVEIELKARGEIAKAAIARVRKDLAALDREKATPGVDLDDSAYLAKKKKLQADLKLLTAQRNEIKFDIQERDATRSLIALSRDLRRTDGDVDRVDGSLRSLVAGFGGAGAGARGLGLHLGPLGGRLSTVLRAATILSPVLLGLGGAATALLGSFGAATLGAGALGTALAGAAIPALALGVGVVSRFSGVLDAFKQDEKAAEAAALDTSSALDTQSDSAERIRTTMIAVRDAREGLTTAERAYRDAVRDTREEIEGARKSEQDAAEALAEAEDELAAATGSDRFAALERVSDAEERLAETRKDRAELERDGIRNNERVVAASEGVRDAEQALAEATRQVGRARKESAQGADGQIRAVQKQAYLTEQLTDSERRLLEQLRAIRDEARDKLQPATDNVFDGMADGLRGIRPLVPALADDMERLGSVVGDQFREAGRELGGDRWTRNFERLTALAIDLTPLLGDVAENVAEIFVNVAIASGPSAVDVMEDLADATERWARSTRDTGGLGDDIEGLVDHTRTWFGLLREVGRLIRNVLGGGAQDGKDLAEELTQVVDRWNDFLETPRGQREMRAFFRDAIAFAKDLLAVLRPTVRLVAGVARELLAWASGVGIADELGKALAVIAVMKFTGLLAVIRGLLGLSGKRGALAAIFGGAATAGGGGAAAAGTPFLATPGGAALAAGGAIAGPNLVNVGGEVARGERSPLSGAAEAGFRNATSPFGVPLHDFRRQTDAGTVATRKLREELEKLAEQRDIPGLRELERQLKDLGPEFDDLRATANVTINDLGDGMRAAADIFERSGGRLRIHVDDLIDRGAAKEVADNVRQMVDSNIVSVGRLRDRMRENVKDIDRAFVHGSRSWSEAMVTNFGAGIRSVRNGMRDGTISVDDGMKEIRRITRQQLTFARDHMDTLSGEGKDALARNMDLSIDAIRRSMKAGRTSTQRGMSEIRKLMVEQLKLYGVDERLAQEQVAKIEHANRGDGRGLAQGGWADPLRAATGWIGRQGERGRDLVRILVGRGEAILNGAQQKVVNFALSRTFGMRRGLGDLFGRVRTPHSATPRFETGGHADDRAPRFAAGGYPGVSGDTDFVPALGRALSRLAAAAGVPISVQSGRRTLAEQQALFNRYGPERAARPNPNAPHVRGIAADINPTYDDARIRANYGRFGLAFPLLNKPGVIREPWHIELAGARGAVGRAVAGLATAALERLPNAPTITGGGVVGTIANRALQTIHGAAVRRFNDLAAAAAATSVEPAPSGGAPAGDLPGSLNRIFKAHRLGEPGARLSPKQVREVAAAADFPSGDVGHMEEIAHGESDYHPGIISSDGGHGLWQMTPRVWGATAKEVMAKLGGLVHMRNPFKNALMAKFLYDDAKKRGNRFSPWFGTQYLTAEGGFAGDDGASIEDYYPFAGSFEKGGTTDPMGVAFDSDTEPRRQLQIATGLTGRAETGIAPYERAIQRMERDYGLREREFGQSEETYVIEPASEGEQPRLDEDAINRRVGELSKLRELRVAIQEKIAEYRDAVLRSIRLYNAAISRLSHAISVLRGSRRGQRRLEKYTAELEKAETRQGELVQLADDLGFNLQDERLNIADLDKELTALDPEHRHSLLGDRGQASPSDDPDLRAQLAQAEQKAANAAEGLRLSEAAVRAFGSPGDIGVGGQTAYGAVLNTGAGAVGSGIGGQRPAAVAAAGGDPIAAAQAGGGQVIVIQTLHPGDPQTLRAIAEASNAGNSHIPYVPSPREYSGV